MKIAVTSQGENMNSEVDPRFGRAKRFIVLDTDTGEQQVVDNTQNLNAVQGAGVQAAQTVVELGVDAVLTGNCGPKAFRVLEAAGIKIYLGVEGEIEAAVAKLKSGQYKAADNFNVEGHW
jgi:predicted Fe-Mo cluster-binding NifX family protein